MIKIREMRPDDKEPVLKIIQSTGMFTEEEFSVALELIDIYLFNKQQKDYIIFVGEFENRVVGYVCYGPAPAAEGVYDMYWIAVDPEKHNMKIGKKLLLHIEEEVTKKSGRMIIIETSSQEKYHPTRRFYLRNGYVLEADIKDFYRKGDDRQIYIKRLSK